MVYTIMYGFTLGAILYFISIGLSITFGTIRVANFAHSIMYTIGVYLAYTFATYVKLGFILSAVLAILAIIPLSLIIERFVIRRLYGESLDYAFIATYAIALIGVDIVKWIWGVQALPLSDPVGKNIDFLGYIFPVYRIIIVALAIMLFMGIQFFVKKTPIGKIIVAALEDTDQVRCLGINIDKYFTFMFILGSALAALGGILYAPITSIHPYMGITFLLTCFACVIIGGLGNLKGTFYAAFILGMAISITARFWSQGSGIVVFIIMAIVLIFRPINI